MQSLSNPLYIHHLALTKHLDDPAFVAYIKYLEYFRRPEYLKYLLYVVPPTHEPCSFEMEVCGQADDERRYPGPTLRALELLQQEQFRKDAVNPQLIDEMVRQGFEAMTAGLG